MKVLCFNIEPICRHWFSLLTAINHQIAFGYNFRYDENAVPDKQKEMKYRLLRERQSETESAVDFSKNVDSLSLFAFFSARFYTYKCVYYTIHIYLFECIDRYR